MSAEIRITRESLFLGRQSLVSHGWLYTCQGPDGSRFDNRSIVTLRDVLRRKYGRDVVIIEPWKGQ